MAGGGKEMLKLLHCCQHKERRDAFGYKQKIIYL